jgi:predicted ATPase
MPLELCEASISGYRSLRRIRFPVRRVSLFVGGNGAGKSNLYRALQLVQAAALGTFAHELAAEGGMQAALWAGERLKNEPARVALTVELEAEDAGAFRYDIAAGLYRYEIEAGIPQIATAASFAFEPQVKLETLTHLGSRRPVELMRRRGPHVEVLEEGGERRDHGSALLGSETALFGLRDAGRLPEMDVVRRSLGEWRFFHDLRTDATSPIRRPCLAVTAPTLAADGSNLAAVFATLVHIREDSVDLDAAIGEAFPSARLVVPPPEQTASFGMIFPEHPKRLFAAAELSDGTLRFLALAGALLSYRLPGLIALNEPEASLHADLLEPLARLVARAAERTQVWIVTHSERFARAVEAETGAMPRVVVKRDGATWIEGLTPFGEFDET